MKIIIAGAGEVGYHLAKLFSYEAHDIMLIDVDEERLAYADKKFRYTNDRRRCNISKTFNAGKRALCRFGYCCHI